MTSNNSAGGGGSGSIPKASTQLSTKTPQASSGVVDREKWRFQVKSSENNLRQSMISFLGIVAHPKGSYSDIRATEDAGHLDWLGVIENDQHMYLPKTISDADILHVCVQLGGTVTDPQINAALYELWLTTKSKTMSEKDRDAMITVYARRLGAYPPDVVSLVLHELSERVSFFPSWQEISDAIEPFCGWRANYTRALRRALRRRRSHEGNQDDQVRDE